MKVDRAIEALGDAEAELGKRLRELAERAAEHDLHHLGHTLARQSAERLDGLAPHAERYGARVPKIEAESPGVLEALRHMTSELLGRAEPVGLVLVRDLLELYLIAETAEIHWRVVVQVAKAMRDAELMKFGTIGP